jgi:hypothetical protein
MLQRAPDGSLPAEDAGKTGVSSPARRARVPSADPPAGPSSAQHGAPREAPRCSPWLWGDKICGDAPGELPARLSVASVGTRPALQEPASARPAPMPDPSSMNGLPRRLNDPCARCPAPWLADVRLRGIGQAPPPGRPPCS